MLEGYGGKSFDERCTKGVPVIVSEIEYLILEGRGFGDIKCCLHYAIVQPPVIYEMIERYLQKWQYERVKIPEQKIFKQLSSFERIRYRHPRLLQRARARWDEPITI